VQCDLLIAGAEVVAESGVRRTNVAVTGGIVESIGDEAPLAVRTIDGDGLVLLPGGVDPHTHLNSVWPFGEERRPADDFASGTRAAAAGGITTVCDFVYHLGGETLVEAAVRVDETAAAGACIDYALHVVVSELRDSFREEVEPLVEAGFPSFKFYTQLPDFVARAPQYIDLLHRIGAVGGLAMFHCEDADIIDYCCQSLAAAGKTAPRHYPESKPPEVEESATAWALNLSSVASVPAYIVHLSSAVALQLALDARARGADVLVETRPLYLHLTIDRFDAPDEEAAMYVGTPPLRTSADRDRLWSALGGGEIEAVGSDHVGFTRAQKYVPGDTLHTVPKGVANLESMLPMLYSDGVRSGRLTLERLAEVTSTLPAKIFGLYPRKGVIREGSDADFCLLDPNERRTISGRSLHSSADFDLFEGTEVVGWPVLTVSRGEVVFEDGVIRGRPGRGRFVPGRQGARIEERGGTR
jgi:dihydropyrimidinase